MSGLAVLAAPPSGDRHDLANWIRNVARGVAQLLQHVASRRIGLAEPGLLVAVAWLATDLATLTEAAGELLETGETEIDDYSDGADRISEILLLHRHARALESPEGQKLLESLFSRAARESDRIRTDPKR